MDFSPNSETHSVYIKQESDATHPIKMEAAESGTEPTTQHQPSQFVPKLDPDATGNLIKRVKREPDDSIKEDVKFEVKVECYNGPCYLNETKQEKNKIGILINVIQDNVLVKQELDEIFINGSPDGTFGDNLNETGQEERKFEAVTVKDEPKPIVQSLLLGTNDTAEPNLGSKTHTAVKIYRCSECDFECKQSNALTVHMRIHTGENPYTCSRCSYKCHSHGYLVRHMQTHLGVKSDQFHRCTKCPYRSTQKHVLRKHMEMHLDEESYVIKVEPDY